MLRILLLAVAVSCLSGARELDAQARFAPQLSVGSKADFGLGGPLAGSAGRDPDV